MKQKSSILYKTQKDKILRKYPSLIKFFEKVENEILEAPNVARIEEILYNNKPIHVRKKYIKTTLFSGLMRDTYKYITITYALTSDNMVVFMRVDLNDYIN
jgi:hypothetical protein